MNKLKMYNIFVWAFAPILLLAICLGVTWSAMTTSDSGRTVITVGSLGTHTFSTNVPVALYPGAELTSVLTVQREGGDIKNVDINNLRITNITINDGASRTLYNNATGLAIANEYFATDNYNALGGLFNFKLDTLQNSLTNDTATCNFNLTIKVKEGSASGALVNTNDYLMQNITSISFTYTIDVNQHI